MNNQTEKLNERLDFYMKAYNETSDDLNLSESEKTKLEKAIDSECRNILEETVPNPLADNQFDSLEKEYQINLDDIAIKHEKLKNDYIKEKESLKSDSRYKEYLNLLINDDLKLVSTMENDEVFAYLMEQKFGTDDFKNEPCIAIWKFKYQPRFWKFKKIADKKAREFGVASFDEMHKLWSGLRINYKSLIENKKITEIIKECEEIENRIKDLDKAVTDYLISRREDIINAITQRIKLTDVSALDLSKFSNLIPLLEKFIASSEEVTSLQNRKTVIMNNINTVEKMISLAEEDHLALDEKSFDTFFRNTNPETPIFELIGDVEWITVKQALEDKGIKTSAQANYSVVRKKISKEEKEDILKRHNVKEGEIFIDQNLVNRDR